MKLRPLAAAGLLAAWLSLGGAAHAALTAFTSKAAFDAAVAGLSALQSVDFEAVPAGTTFASGTGTGGLTFFYVISGPSTLQVADTFGTTSGTNYLGLDNPDTAFYLGDSFTIDFNRAVVAVGLYVIAGNDAQAGDIGLSVANGSVFNSAIADVPVSDGQAFFLGLVESDFGSSFTSATLAGTFTPGAFLAFTVDDISSAIAPVPEPETWLLLLAGLGAASARARRRR